MLSRNESFRTYLACERNCDAASYHFPQRTLRDSRYKIIYTLLPGREDPGALKNHHNVNPHWSGTLNPDELRKAPEIVQKGYATWMHPPRVQLYDLKNDPFEWHDLSADTNHAEFKFRLLAALQAWQKDTRDPLADPTKLDRLTRENAEAADQGTRTPKGGWKYYTYLAPVAP